ncbi:MAG: tryptophan synthase subunit alpha [Phycisphaerales bacterium]|nr:tryptophan synthase subunit alpha [Planctomycetota bacterium]
MGRVEAIFQDLRGSGRKALMPFICAGHPRPNATAEILRALDKAGASIVEVGFPFSDPVADGPIIAAAMHESIRNGCTPGAVLDEVRAVRGELSLGLIAMISVSILHKLASASDPRQVANAFAQAGFDGFIFPDLPLEESENWRAAAAEAGLTASLLISPSTPPERAQQIARACTGFVYVLARAGITGESGAMPDLSGRIGELRRVTDLPLAVGFGVSSPEHVRHVVTSADAAIVGSALVRRLSEVSPTESAAQVAGDFCRKLCSGLTEARV